MKQKLKRWLSRRRKQALELPDEFKALKFSSAAMHKLLSDFEFNSVLDVGSGSGDHARFFMRHDKAVTAVDFAKSVYYDSSQHEDYPLIQGDFFEVDFDKTFDCVWASHVLEHQTDSGKFIRRCIELLNDDGILAITVPPLKHKIVGGHLTLWNAGLLLYQLCFNGLDCSQASIRSYGYNISIILRKKARPDIELDYDSGDIDRLKPYLPEGCFEGFDGRIESSNW